MQREKWLNMILWLESQKVDAFNGHYGWLLVCLQVWDWLLWIIVDVQDDNSDVAVI